MNARELLKLSPVMPVLVIENLAEAVPLAKALVAGGIRVLEVTLRTPVALEAIREIAAHVSDAVVGAGTLLDTKDVERAQSAGARFGVSPGITPGLLSLGRNGHWPLIPGVMTPSEALAAMEAGFDTAKFFPASQAGGVAALKAFAGPLPQLKFCPTGGIDAGNAREYLSLSNVLCVGGSWLAPKGLVAAKDWTAITQLAEQAAAWR